MTGQTRSQRVLVIGGGSIGGLISARLSASEEVDIAIAARTLFRELKFTSHGSTVTPQVRIVSSPQDLDGEYQWVVVATKTYDTASIAEWLTSPACSGASVAVAQNGVEHVERLKPWVSEDRVLPMIVTYGAARRSPGWIVENLDGVVRVPRGRLGDAFAGLAAGGTLNVELVEDFSAALWTKLTWNVVGNSLSTIVDCPVREIAVEPALRHLAEVLAAECVVVASTQGAALDPGIASGILHAFAGYSNAVRSSMLQDRDAGRPFEHDAISGAVVRAAAYAGIEAPYSRMATDLLEVLSP